MIQRTPPIRGPSRRGATWGHALEMRAGGSREMGGNCLVSATDVVNVPQLAHAQPVRYAVPHGVTDFAARLRNAGRKLISDRPLPL